jgi:hypothetical protein
MDKMAKKMRHQGIWGSLDFTSNLRWLGLCAFISMLALPLKSYADIDQLGLDTVTNFAVYAGGSLTVNGATTANGDVGLGPNGTQNFGDAFTINGTYWADSTVGATVAAVSAYAALLPATTNFTRINSATTIIGNGGTNVIDVGTISLNGTFHTLTLQGGPNDVFVFNVSNNVAFLGTWPTLMSLSSGVATNHILFNLLNTSSTANALTVTVANVTLFGTFIAPDASMDIIGSDDTIYGGLFAGGNNLTLNSGTITADVFEIPEPSSFALVGISCLIGLGLRSRRRR